MTLTPRIAFLLTNGFDETQFTEIQRALVAAGHRATVIAPENGVVMGWKGGAWGLSFGVEASLNTALGSDYDMLVLVGGERGVSRLEGMAHAKRIIGHFIDAQKPVAALAEAVRLLAKSGRDLSGHTFAAASSMKDVLATVGGTATDAAIEEGSVFMTARLDDPAADLPAVVKAILDHIPTAEALAERQKVAA